MENLIIVSNRLPVTVEKRKGDFIFNQSAGGLSTGLGSIYKSYDSIWVGWSGSFRGNYNEKEREYIETRLRRDFSFYPIFLSHKDVDLYYNGFCNKTIWPLFHYFIQYAIFDYKLWETYKKVNELFCEKILEIANPNDVLWVHDYHLMLLLKLLWEKLPKVTIDFFLHIPFPSYEIFRLLLWRSEILEGLLGADLIGFHTYSYVKHFLETIRLILDYEHT